jgi:hypothetical protein
MPTSGPQVDINPPWLNGQLPPGMGPGGIPSNPFEDDFFNPKTYPTPLAVWDPVRWNITNAPGAGSIPFNPQSPIYPNWINMPGLPGSIGTITDPYTGNPRASIPGAYAPNLYPARPPDDTGPLTGPAHLSRVSPIPTQDITPGPVMSMPFRPEETFGQPMDMPGPDLPPVTLDEPSTVNLWRGEAPTPTPTPFDPRSLAPYGDYTGGVPNYSGDYYGPIGPVSPEPGFNLNVANPFPEFTDYTAPTPDFNAVTTGGPALEAGAADYGGGSLYGGINPWEFSVPTAGTGVAAAPAAMTPYDYNLPSNPFSTMGNANLWAGEFTAPQYDPATLSRVLGGSGLPPSAEEPGIPTAPGVWPPSLPAQPVDVAGGQPAVAGGFTPQFVPPGQPGLYQGWQNQLPFGKALGLRTNYGNLGNMLRSGAGALGRFFSGLPGSIPALPAGYNPFGGTPPGLTETNRFGGGAPIFRGDPSAGFVGPPVAPGGVYRETLNLNPLPMGGQVGSSSVPAPGASIGGGFGGGGPVYAGTYTSPWARAELYRWMRGGYTPPGPAKYPSPVLTDAWTRNAPFMRSMGFGPTVSLSPQQQQALAQQWGNVFRERGYVFPPTAGGRGGPVPAPSVNVSRHIPPRSTQ